MPRMTSMEAAVRILESDTDCSMGVSIDTIREFE
jgi:hypothetical protein